MSLIQSCYIAELNPGRAHTHSYMHAWMFDEFMKCVWARPQRKSNNIVLWTHTMYLKNGQNDLWFLIQWLLHRFTILQDYSMLLHSLLPRSPTQLTQVQWLLKGILLLSLLWILRWPGAVMMSGFCVMNQIAQSIYLMTCWVVQTDLCNLATGKQLNCRHKDDFRDPFVNYHQTTIAARVPECDFSLLYWSPLTSLIPRPEDLRLQDWEWE